MYDHRHNEKELLNIQRSSSQNTSSISDRNHELKVNDDIIVSSESIDASDNNNKLSSQ